MAQVFEDPSYYEVLGVAPTATPNEVRSAYRRLTLQTHPDAGGNGALFRLVTSAYETLSDPGRRAAYDVALANGMPVAAAPRPEAEAGDGPLPNRSANVSPSPRSPRRRRLAAGAALGAVWYLLRATGALSWVLGARAAGSDLPAAVESWARPITLGKAVLCIVTGAAVGFWSRVSRIRTRVGSMRWGWMRAAVASLLLSSMLLMEYLVTIQGRRALILGATVASGAWGWVGRRRMRHGLVRRPVPRVARS